MGTLTPVEGIDIAYQLSNEIDAILPEGWSGGSSYEWWGDPDEDECWRCYKITHGTYDYYQFSVSSKGKFYGFIPDEKVLMDVIRITKKYQKYLTTPYGKFLVKH